VRDILYGAWQFKHKCASAPEMTAGEANPLEPAGLHKGQRAPRRGDFPHHVDSDSVLSMVASIGRTGLHRSLIYTHCSSALGKKGTRTRI
jgi:hypothetical protein